MENFQTPQQPQFQQPVAPVTPPVNPKDESGPRILGVNLIILAVYFILFLVGGSMEEETTMLYFGAYMFHGFVLFILAIVRMFQKKQGAALAYLFTAIVAPIIGFGACSAAAATGLLNGDFL